MVAHGNLGVHAVAMALWESGGASATVIGGLPLPVRQAIFGLFHMVYRLVKWYGSFTQLAADAETATLVGGQVAPAFRSPAAPREIAHAIARRIRAAGGEQVLQSAFFALPSDSSTDYAANKQELVYTRTMRIGRSHTAFLGLQDLRAGTAVAIVAAYKHVMLRDGLPNTQTHVSQGMTVCQPPPPHLSLIRKCITLSLPHVAHA